MAPEVIMVLALIIMATANKEKGKRPSKDLIMGVCAFVTVLIWGGFFNDTWGLIRAGYTAIFN